MDGWVDLGRCCCSCCRSRTSLCQPPTLHAVLGEHKTTDWLQPSVRSLLGVEDGPQQREHGDVGSGDLHGGQVLHVVLEGPLRLAAQQGTHVTVGKG